MKDVDWNELERKRRASADEYQELLRAHANDPWTYVEHPYDEPTRVSGLRARRYGQLAETFPRRALDVAWRPDDTAPAIRLIEDWAKERRSGIAVLAGVPGCGKTVAATWLALRVQNDRFAPSCIRATELARLSWFEEEAIARWHDQRFLVLDDLGSEATAIGVLDELVDTFYAELRVLVITTNLAQDAFRERYRERIWDRLRETGGWLPVRGTSRRGRKK